ncbi:hypothetical protein FKM82_013055 [Ascaphus truei]
MRSLLQVLCVLSALVATGYSLSCIVCEDMDGMFCTSPSKTCPADNVCMFSYIENTAGGIENTVLTRTCESQSKCDMSGSLTFTAFKTKMSTSCCSTDNCTPSEPTLPADNNTKNGVTCPSCMNLVSDYCSTLGTIQCTGEEKKCLLQSRTSTGSISSTVAIRGCATESFCNVGSKSESSDGDITTEVKNKCTNGSIGLHPGFFFPAMALLLLKLLF